MKVCIVSTFYGSNVGGAEVSIGLLIDSLKDKGIDIKILTIVDNIKDDDIRHVPLPKFLPRKSIILGNRFIDYLLSKEIKKILKEERPDIVHVHDLYSLPGCVMASKDLNIPIVITVRDNLPKKLSETYNFVMDTILNYLLGVRNNMWIKSLHNADGVVAISNFIRKSLENVGINKEKILVIHNISPLWTFEGRSDDIKGITLLAPGRFHEEKGFDIAIRALKIILEYEKNIKLILLGDGPHKSKLMRLVNNLNLSDNVIFVPHVPFKDVKKFYQMSDIVIFPSTYSEPLGRVAIEAGISSKPVIASNVGGIPEIIIDGKTGYLVRPDSPSDIAKKVMLLINDKSLRNNMGTNAREYVMNKFNAYIITNEHITLYKDLINEYRS